MSDVQLLIRDTAWILMIDRPPANTLSSTLLDRLSDVVRQFDNHPGRQILVITGAGERFFVGGVDPYEIESIRSPAHGYRMAKKGQDLCNAVEALSKPVIAAINGHCIGGGNELALACHIRIASENSVFQQPELELGIMPAFGGTQRLPRLIGEGRARKMILTCERVSAQEALTIRLVDEVVERGEALNRALTIADSIATKSWDAVRLVGNCVRNAFARDERLGLRLELNSFKQICKGDDMREGLAAYRERRKPSFKKPQG